MAAQAVSLRTQIAVAINLLQSGAVDPYGLFFELECSGEDSPEMRLVREVCDEMAITDAELTLWQHSYLMHLARNAQAIDQRLLEQELRDVIARLRCDKIESFAWFESALYLEDLETTRGEFVLGEEGVTSEEFTAWQTAFRAIPAERRRRLDYAYSTFRSIPDTV